MTESQQPEQVSDTSADQAAEAATEEQAASAPAEEAAASEASADAPAEASAEGADSPVAEEESEGAAASDEDSEDDEWADFDAARARKLITKLRAELKEAKAYKRTLQVSQALHAAGLSDDLADLVPGSTEAEIAAGVKRLAELAGTAKRKRVAPSAGALQAADGATPQPVFDAAAIARKARRR